MTVYTFFCRRSDLSLLEADVLLSCAFSLYSGVNTAKALFSDSSCRSLPLICRAAFKSNRTGGARLHTVTRTRSEFYFAFQKQNVKILRCDEGTVLCQKNFFQVSLKPYAIN